MIITTAPDTTTTTPPAMTTAMPPETTTASSAPPDAAVVIDEVETAEGWRYQVAVVPAGTDPEASGSGCLDVAPPGQTHVVFDIQVTNLIEDRSAPSPQMIFSSNLAGDGSVISGPDVFSAEMIEARTTQRIAEVTPIEDGTACVLAGVARDGIVSIEAGGSFTFRAKMGPLSENALADFLGGIRVTTEVGSSIEATFGTEPGSGEVVGEHSVREES